MTKSNKIHSGGIKPLNAPRVIYVRTDTDGNPISVQVPPAINSPRARRTRRQGNNPHPNPLPSRERGQAVPPSQPGRELEGGPVRARPTQQARALRRNATPAENQLWKYLRKTQIQKYKFTRQYPIGPYIVDFCCRTARLVIELDGGHHATQQESDIARQQDLEDHGYRVIRFWNNEVFENIEGVMFKVVEELENNNPHPNPSLAPGVHSHLVAGAKSAGSPRARERGQTGPPSQAGREEEGGSAHAFRSSTRSNQSTASDLSVKVPSAPLAPLVSDGAWMKVTAIENLWKVNDEWWRGPEEEIARLYYVLRLANGQQLTVYLDLVANSWHRQAG